MYRSVPAMLESCIVRDGGRQPRRRLRALPAEGALLSSRLELRVARRPCSAPRVDDRTVGAYCDGSVTNAIWSDVFTSELGAEYIGRAMVLVPAHDVGLIAQSRVGMITSQQTPASTEAEVFAIRTALDLCVARDLGPHTVYSDCQAAVDRFRDQPVEWRSRQQMRLPNDFFDKVLRRASYLRSSSGKVSSRRPAAAHQTEAFELFNFPYREFRLSDSLLWERICRDAARYPEALDT